MNIKRLIWLKLRLVMGLIFLWAFIDKLLGLGFSTVKENAWVNGGSPTTGFLTHAVRGPFAEIFKSLAGLAVVDWLFMLGLLGVGLSLIINRFVTLAAISGSIMLALMYLATFPPANNPLLDEHIVYILVIALLALKKRDG